MQPTANSSSSTPSTHTPTITTNRSTSALEATSRMTGPSALSPILVRLTGGVPYCCRLELRGTTAAVHQPSRLAHPHLQTHIYTRTTTPTPHPPQTNRRKGAPPRPPRPLLHRRRLPRLPQGRLQARRRLHLRPRRVRVLAAPVALPHQPVQGRGAVRAAGVLLCAQAGRAARGAARDQRG